MRLDLLPKPPQSSTGSTKEETDCGGVGGGLLRLLFAMCTCLLVSGCQNAVQEPESNVSNTRKDTTVSKGEEEIYLQPAPKSATQATDKDLVKTMGRSQFGASGIPELAIDSDDFHDRVRYKDRTHKILESKESTPRRKPVTANNGEAWK
ncbi:MAG: hypothetical protein LBJ77_03660 [Holosporales bacterium]|jgi:hypothetical protein|nr:hypothetical protein [Holosporales bacterium]